MDILATKTVWTFWLGVAVSILVVVSVIALMIGYFVKVVRPQYPPRSAKRT